MILTPLYFFNSSRSASPVTRYSLCRQRAGNNVVIIGTPSEALDFQVMLNDLFYRLSDGLHGRCYFFMCKVKFL